MQSLYEHIVQLFAQAAFEILTDQKLSFIDPSNPYASLPYLIIQTLNQNLLPKNLRNMPSNIVRTLVSVVVSVFALPWSDNNSQNNPSLATSSNTNTLPAQNSNNNKKMSGNEADTTFSGNENSAENIDSKSTRKNTIVTDSGLLTPGNLKQSSEVDILKLAKTYVESLWNEGWKDEVIELVKEAVSFISFLFIFIIHLFIFFFFCHFSLIKMI
jgi:hypothetical protein